MNLKDDRKEFGHVTLSEVKKILVDDSDLKKL